MIPAENVTLVMPKHFSTQTIQASFLPQSKAFRELHESDALQSHVVVSPTASGGIPQRIWIPNADRFESFPIPPFTEVMRRPLLISLCQQSWYRQDEMACVLCYYWQQQLIQAVHPHSMKRLFFVTGGNMHDLKRALSTL